MIIKNIKQRVLPPLADFRFVGLAFIIFSLLNLAIFVAIFLWPGLFEYLWLSADRP
jgi:hypothetical protein